MKLDYDPTTTNWDREKTDPSPPFRVSVHYNPHWETNTQLAIEFDLRQDPFLLGSVSSSEWVGTTKEALQHPSRASHMQLLTQPLCHNIHLSAFDGM